jgi:hypothetical protein
MDLSFLAAYLLRMGWNTRVNQHTRINKDISVDSRIVQAHAAAVLLLIVERARSRVI